MSVTLVHSAWDGDDLSIFFIDFSLFILFLLKIERNTSVLYDICLTSFYGFYWGMDVSTWGR